MTIVLKIIYPDGYNRSWCMSSASELTARLSHVINKYPCSTVETKHGIENGDLGYAYTVLVREGDR